MTKSEYLIAVASKVTSLSGERAALYDEAGKLINFYSELIDDKIEEGMSEEDAVAGMEAPEAIAERVAREMSVARAAEAKVKPVAAKKSAPSGENIESMGEFTRKTGEFSADGVKKIEVLDENHGVELVGGADALVISRVEGPDGYYEIIEGETLSVRFISLTKWYRRLFSLNLRRDTNLRISIPKGMVCEFNVHTTDGRIKAESLTADGSALFRTTNGAIGLSDVCSSGKLHAETSNGALTLEDVCGETVVAKTSNGALNLEDVTAAAIKASTSNGRLTSSNIAAKGGVELITSNGGNTASNITASSVRVSSSNSTVNVERIHADSITLSSSNGSIIGILPGAMKDYAITSRTTNGKNNLPPATDGAKKLDVKTTNSKIDIGFEE